MHNGRFILHTFALAFAMCLGMAFAHLQARGSEDSVTDKISPVATCLTLATEDGQIVLQRQLAPKKQFVLTHRHSVHRSLVREYLEAGPNSTVSVVEGHYSDYGAGLPQKAESGQTLRFERGNARLVLAPTYLNTIEIRVGREAEHTLILQDKEYILAKLIEPGMVAILSISEKVCPHESP